MTLDSSALVAIVFGETGYLDLVDRMLEADVVRLGAPTLTARSRRRSISAGLASSRSRDQSRSTSS